VLLWLFHHSTVIILLLHLRRSDDRAGPVGTQIVFKLEHHWIFVNYWLLDETLTVRTV